MILAEIRKPDTKLGEYRRQGKLPAVVYGHGEETNSILLDLRQYDSEIKKHGEGTLLDLKIGKNEPFKVLLQDYQKDPVKGDLLHVDLYRIKMDEKLSTEIALSFVGESPAVKLGGVLIKSRDYLQVECLPQYLVSSIEVDLSALEKVHDSFKVADIKIPEGITVLDNQNLTVVNVSEAAVLEEVEVSKEEEEEAIEALEQKEGEEGAEGAEGSSEGKPEDKKESAQGGQGKSEGKSEDKKAE